MNSKELDDLLFGRTSINTGTGSGSNFTSGNSYLSEDEVDSLADEASRTYGVPKHLIRGIIDVENPKYDPKAKNPNSSATGLMQTIDSTSKALGINDPTNPRESVFGGTKLLKQLLDKYGDEETATAAYFQGEAKVDSYIKSGKTVKNMTETDATGTDTQTYLSKVGEKKQKYQPGGQRDSATYNTPQKMGGDDLDALLFGTPNTQQQQIPFAQKSDSFGVLQSDQNTTSPVMQPIIGIQQPTSQDVSAQQPQLGGVIPEKAVSPQEQQKGQLGKVIGPLWEGGKDVVRSLVNYARAYSEKGKSNWESLKPQIEQEKQFAEKRVEIFKQIVEREPNNEDAKKKLKEYESQLKGSRNLLENAEGFIKQFSKETKGFKGVTEGALKAGEYRQADTGVGKFFQEVARGAPQVIGTMATYAMGGAPISTLSMFAQIAGGKYEELEKEGVDLDRALSAGLVSAAAQAPLEMLPIADLVKGIGTKSIKRIAGSAIEEFITETLQNYPDAIAEIWAKTEGKSFEERKAIFFKDLKNITLDGLRQGAVAAVTSVLLGGAGAGANKALEMYDNNKVKKEQAQLKPIQDKLNADPDFQRAMNAPDLTGTMQPIVDMQGYRDRMNKEQVQGDESIAGKIASEQQQVENAAPEGLMPEPATKEQAQKPAEEPGVYKEKPGSKPVLKSIVERTEKDVKERTEAIKYAYESMGVKNIDEFMSLPEDEQAVRFNKLDSEATPKNEKAQKALLEFTRVLDLKEQEKSVEESPKTPESTPKTPESTPKTPESNFKGKAITFKGQQKTFQGKDVSKEYVGEIVGSTSSGKFLKVNVKNKDGSEKLFNVPINRITEIDGVESIPESIVIPKEEDTGPQQVDATEEQINVGKTLAVNNGKVVFQKSSWGMKATNPNTGEKVDIKPKFEFKDKETNGNITMSLDEISSPDAENILETKILERRKAFEEGEKFRKEKGLTPTSELDAQDKASKLKKLEKEKLNEGTVKKEVTEEKNIRMVGGVSEQENKGGKQEGVLTPLVGSDTRGGGVPEQYKYSGNGGEGTEISKPTNSITDVPSVQPVTEKQEESTVSPASEKSTNQNYIREKVENKVVKMPVKESTPFTVKDSKHEYFTIKRIDPYDGKDTYDLIHKETGVRLASATKLEDLEDMTVANSARLGTERFDEAIQNMVDKVKGEEIEAPQEMSELYTKSGFHPRSYLQLEEGINEKNPNVLESILHLRNKKTRELFTAKTGVELPGTMKGTVAAIRSFVGADKYDNNQKFLKEVALKKEEEEKQKRYAEERDKLLDTKITYNGTPTTYRGLIEDRINEGWTVESEKKGIREVYRLTNGEISVTLPKKMMGEYAQEQYVKKGEELDKEIESKIPESEKMTQEEEDHLFGKTEQPSPEQIKKEVVVERPEEQKAEFEAINTNPTEPQKEAGNYRKGHIKRDGMDISIENAAGQERKGTDKAGKEWKVTMNHDYGYIRGTKGADAYRDRSTDQLDVFINPGSEEGGDVFVVNQKDPKTGKFDEAKVMMGFKNKVEAAKAYNSNYETGWKGLKSVVRMPMEQFKKWAYSEDTKNELTQEIADKYKTEQTGAPEKVEIESTNNIKEKTDEKEVSKKTETVLNKEVETPSSEITVKGIKTGDSIKVKDTGEIFTVKSVDQNKGSITTDGGTFSDRSIADGNVQKVETPPSDPNAKLVNDYVHLIKTHHGNKEKIPNTRKILDLADKAHGGTIAEGKYGIRDAYDALETAMNKYVEEIGLDEDPKETIKKLNNAIKVLPTQTVRTEDQVEKQQFSTPPSEAYLAVMASGIKEGMTGLEPSAGDGNIATIMRLANKGKGEIYTNEIDERRRNNLKILGFNPTDADAEYLHSTLPKEIQPDVVVMNPPFSATGGRLKQHDTGFGAEHVRQALLRLKDGGRLVAIVGNGMAFGKPKMASWWNGIRDKYNVRANVGISGKEYEKYGTGFDNNIIVIDKTGKTGSIQDIVTGSDLTVEKAYDLLEPLMKEDVNGRIKRDIADGTEKVGSKEPERKTSEKKFTVGSDVTPPVGSGRGSNETTGTGTNKAAVEGMGKSGNKLSGESGTSNTGKVTEGGESAEPVKNGSTGNAGPDENISNGDTGGSERKSSGEGRVEEEENSVYAKYTVKKATYPGSVPHQANIVESATMASVDLPNVTYKLNIPKEIIKKGAPSDIQLEAATYAGQTHEQLLPDGRRKEYLLGDSTGTGKTITILTTIYDNWMRGRKKAVVITKSKGLIKDLRDDMKMMGIDIPVIDLSEYKMSEAVEAPEGILFSTYATASGGWTKGRERYNQIKNWFGKDNDGVFVFDEAHLMKNASAETPTNTGSMGIKFKDELKNARFLNASATAATNSKNLAYLTRMGLWGEGSSFKNFNEFLGTMTQGGLGAMELLSRDMKANGNYISRTISYKGVDYETLNHTMNETEIASYNSMADFWSEILQRMDEAAKNSGLKGRAARNHAKQYYAAQQRFFLQLMVSFQVETMLKDADKKLNDGKSVVISLFNTNEQQTEKKVGDAQAQGVDIDDMDFTPRDMMIDMIKKNFPVDQYQEVQRDDGTKEYVKVTDKAGNPLKNAENEAIMNELVDKVATFKMPDNPLDRIVNYFGEGKVSEVTGRKKRLVMVNGKKVYKARATKDVSAKDVNRNELDQFMDGKKRVAVLSGAAATGFSFHSSTKKKNQQRRVFYALQLSWSADQQMQAFGRVHRTMQANAPEIVLVQTDIASQKRLVNTIQSRLASLGAISKGERESLSGGIFSIEDITDEYGDTALRDVLSKMSMDKLKRMGLVTETGKSKEVDVDGFLNRLMVLQVKDQNEIFDQFYGKYRDAVDKAKEAGLYDTGVEKIKGENVRIEGEPILLSDDKQSGVKTEILNIAHDVETVKRTFKQANERLSGKRVSYVRNKKSGDPYMAYVQESDIHIYGPRWISKKIPYTQVREGFYDKYEKVEDGEFEKLWNEKYKEIPKVSTQHTHIVTGSIFNNYKKIFEASAEGSFSNLKVKRAVLDNGVSKIGVYIPQSMIEKIKQNFGIGTDLVTASPEKIVELVRGGSIIEFDNRWKLKKSKVMGDERIELNIGNDYNTGYIEKMGLFNEIIAGQKRYFVPTGDTMIETIKNIMNKTKPVRDLTVKSEESVMASAPLFERDVTKENQIYTPEFKRWFGDWENDPDIVSAAGTIDGSENKQRTARRIFEKKFVDKFYGEQRVPVVGVRYGDAPESGRSYNTMENRYESGISTMQVNDLPGVNSFAVAAAKSRDLRYYAGMAIKEVGGDGEILITDVTPINKEKYNSFVNSPEGVISSYVLAFWRTDAMGSSGQSRTYPDLYKKWDDLYNKKEADLVSLLQGVKSKKNEDITKQTPSKDAANKKPSTFASAVPTFKITDLAKSVTPAPVKVNPVQTVSTAPSGKKLQYAQASNRLGNQISNEPKEVKDTNFLTPIEKIKTNWFEDVFPLQKIEDIHDKDLGVSREGAREMDKAIDAVLGSPGATHRYIDENLTPIIREGTKGAKSPGEVYVELNKYLVAKRASWLYDNNPNFADIGINKVDANNYVEFIETGAHPHYDRIMKMAISIWQYEKNLLKIKRDANVLGDIAIAELDEPHYVPFYRDMETIKDAGKTQAGGQRYYTLSTGVKKGIKGSLTGKKVIDPIQSIQLQTYETIINANRNKCTNALFKLAEESEEVKKYFTLIPDKWVKAGTIEYRMEADALLRPMLEDMAKNDYGLTVEYKTKLAARVKGRLEKVLGLYKDDTLKTLVGSTEGTFAHELGHAIHEKTSWYRDFIKDNSTELNNVAATRYLNVPGVDKKFIDYVQTEEEKAAEFIAMYVIDREGLNRLAPKAMQEFGIMILADNTMKKLIGMQPSNVKGIYSKTVDNIVQLHQVPRDADVISGFVDGKITSYRVPVEIADAVKNMDVVAIPEFIRILFTPINKIVRAGAVAYNIDFLASNPARDVQESAFKGRTIPIYDFIRGAYEVATNGKYLKEWERHYGSMNHAEAGNKGYLRNRDELKYGNTVLKYLDPEFWNEYKILKGSAKAAFDVFKSPLEAIRAMSGALEAATRVGTYRRARRALPKGMQWYSGKPMDIEDAIRVSRDATNDFQRGGKYSKKINSIIPFSNAAIRGLYTTYRYFRDDPKRALLGYFVYAIVPTLLQFLMTKDEEWYKAIKLKERLDNWIIPNPLRGREDLPKWLTGPYFTIPKGFWMQPVANPLQIALEKANGMLLKSNLTAYSQVIEDVDPYGISTPAIMMMNYMTSSYDNMPALKMLPVSVRMILDPALNYDFYWHKEIEEPWDKASSDRRQRYDKYTSESMKMIGKALNISPKMLQHEFELVGAGAGKNLLWLADYALGKRSDKGVDFDRVPIVRRFYGKIKEFSTDMDEDINLIDKQLRMMNDYKANFGKRKMTSEQLNKIEKSNTKVKQLLYFKRRQLVDAKARALELLKNQE